MKDAAANVAASSRVISTKGNYMAGRTQNMPPSAFGRFLAAMRAHAYDRICSDPSKSELKREVYEEGKRRLTRKDLCTILQVTGYSKDGLSEDLIRNYETGRTDPPDDIKMLLLDLLQLTSEEQQSLINDHGLFASSNATGLTNPHLVPNFRSRILLTGEYGPLIDSALPIADMLSTWVEVEKSSSGGFEQDEVSADVIDIDISNYCKHPRFKAFQSLSQQALRENQARIASGVRGWSNNSTLALDSVVHTMKDDDEERNQIALRFVRSQYMYNVVAKGEQGAAYRWQALQDAQFPPQPLNFLASGVGICINTICDGGKSIVVGQRSMQETFRKGERDIAVVEGIRPTSDVEDGAIDMRQVCYRALNEELGLDKISPGKSAVDFIKRLSIFEFGVDLKFYQWNFLSFVNLDLSFEDIESAWRKAKDRRENQRLSKIPLDRDGVEAFIQNNAFWSAGAACAMRTFDYL